MILSCSAAYRVQKHNCNRSTQNLQEKIWETLLPNVIFTHLVSNRQVTEELDPTTKSWAIEDD